MELKPVAEADQEKIVEDFGENVPASTTEDTAIAIGSSSKPVFVSGDGGIPMGPSASGHAEIAFGGPRGGILPLPDDTESCNVATGLPKDVPVFVSSKGRGCFSRRLEDGTLFNYINVTIDGINTEVEVGKVTHVPPHIAEILQPLAK